MRFSAVSAAIVALLAAAVTGGSSISAAASGARAITSKYNALGGVSCPSPSFCMAVGQSGQGPYKGLRTLAEQWDGKSWHIVPTLNASGGDVLNSVSCASATSCLAVGDADSASVPVSEEWNGTAWSLLRTPYPKDGRDAILSSVSCPTSSSCVAVGSSGDHSGSPVLTMIERWNGLRWTLAASPNPSGDYNVLWGVDCLSPARCTAVGDIEGKQAGTEATLVEQGNGSRWTVVRSPGVPGRSTMLGTVDCVSASACTATGATYHETASNYTSTPLIEREATGSWHVSPAPHPAGDYAALSGVACTTATRCMAVGSAASSSDVITTLAESENAGTWSIVPSPNAPGTLSALGGLSCVSSALCMAVGDNDNGNLLPLSELWNGKAWKIIPTPNP